MSQNQNLSQLALTWQTANKHQKNKILQLAINRYKLRLNKINISYKDNLISDYNYLVYNTLESYDSTKKCKFETYLYNNITYFLKSFFKDKYNAADVTNVDPYIMDSCEMDRWE